MTLLIHSSKIENGYSVKWAMKSRSVCGIHEVKINDSLPESRVLAEISALSLLLSKFPGKAGNIQSSNGGLKKLINSENAKRTHAITEFGNLLIKYQNLNVESDKKTSRLIESILEEHDQARHTQDEWQGLGRPTVSTSALGDIEVSVHAMERYRERFAPTGTLSRLEQMLLKPFKVESVKTKGDKTYKVLRSLVNDFVFVVAEGAGQRRMTTCYKPF